MLDFVYDTPGYIPDFVQFTLLESLEGFAQRLFYKFWNLFDSFRPTGLSRTDGRERGADLKGTLGLRTRALCGSRHEAVRSSFGQSVLPNACCTEVGAGSQTVFFLAAPDE